MVEHPEERETPLWRHVLLLVGFLLVIVAAVFTVLLPELEDEGGDGPERAAEGPSASEDEAEAPGDGPTASK
ncbi:MAG: hypothetical protein ACOCUS_06230 [Polyangiales bacterium]